MATLHIDGYIGNDSFMGDSFSLKTLNAFLETVKDEKELTVKINSGGGSVTEGFAIHDALVTSGKNITTEVLGMCGSIATIIALSAPKGQRFMHKNSQYFIHNPIWTPMNPEPMEASDLERLSADLKDAEERILNFYSEKTGADKSKIKKFMNNSTSFSADEAKELGFISDVVTQNIEAQRKYLIAAYISKTPNMQVEKSWLENQFKAIEAKISKVFKAEIDPVQASDPFAGVAVAAPDGEYTVTVADGKITASKAVDGVDATVKAENEKLQAELKAATEKVEAVTKESAEAKDAVKKLSEEVVAFKKVVLGDAPATVQTFKGKQPEGKFSFIKNNALDKRSKLGINN